MASIRSPTASAALGSATDEARRSPPRGMGPDRGSSAFSASVAPTRAFGTRGWVVIDGPPTTVVEESQDGADARRQLSLCIAHTPTDEVIAPIRLGERTVLVVGRDVGELGLRIDDPKLSRRHFQVTWDGRQGAPRLTDAGSSNGTAVNGRLVTTMILSPGDVVRAGGSLFVLDDTAPRATFLAKLDRAAASTLTVLLVGETGTGKEVTARRLHEQSGRTGPFVPVNCGAIPRDLMAAEFFGHTRGAFSGAGAPRPGLFVAARGGTLFLDEVGELSAELQPTLLRALEERRVRPVGAEREIDVDVRLLAATNRPLDDLRADDGFRADLYARLAQVVFSLPPLRERRPELLALARELAVEAGGELTLTANAAEALLLWSWPHNVRELKSLVAAHLVLHPAGTPLTRSMLEELRPELGTAIRDRGRRTSGPPAPVEGALRNPLADRQQLEQLLARHGGNIRAVAEELGTHRTQVYRWLERLGIERKPR